MKNVHGIWLPDGDTHFSDHLAREKAANGVPSYQSAKFRAALKLCPKGRRRHALDIGGHVGLWSRQMAAVFESVTAFEPVPELIECFVRNMASAARPVVLETCALGNRNGRTGIARPAENSGNGYVAPGRTYPLLKLDSLDRGPVDFIKIDVEGYELEVVKGGEKTIRANRPVMVVEQKPGHGARYGVSDTAAVDLLVGWGAKVAWAKAGDYCLVWE